MGALKHYGFDDDGEPLSREALVQLAEGVTRRRAQEHTKHLLAQHEMECRASLLNESPTRQETV